MTVGFYRLQFRYGETWDTLKGEATGTQSELILTGSDYIKKIAVCGGALMEAIVFYDQDDLQVGYFGDPGCSGMMTERSFLYLEGRVVLPTWSSNRLFCRMGFHFLYQS